MRDLLVWLEACGARAVLMGGVAASLLGRRARPATSMCWCSLDEKDWSLLLSQSGRFGFSPRIPDPLSFARRSRALLMRHSSGLDADLVFGSLPFEREVVARAVPVKVSDLDLPLPTPEDLIIMKAVARRPRDVVDIEAILDAHSQLDLQRVRYWVQQFA